MFDDAAGELGVKPFKHVRWRAVGAFEDQAAGRARLVKGAGGDNVFFLSAGAHPLGDLLDERRFDVSAFGLLFAAARRGRTTIWQSLSQLRALDETVNPLARLASLSRSFLNPEIAASLDANDMLAHDWYGQSDLPAGKRLHVAMILGAQHFFETYYPASAPAPFFPLLSQPVMEACIRTPTYFLAGGAQDRSLARSSFADWLAPDILKRRIKGRFTGYFRKLFMLNAARLRDLLLGGALAEEGVIDRNAVEDYFAQGPPMDTDFFQLIEYADVELWARAWRA